MVILGIDEVGRGPWAGPLVIGACILNPGEDWQEQLTDSKKLSAKKREELSKEIKTKALAYATGWVSAEELDRIGLAEALRLATRRAVLEIKNQKVKFNEIIIDGTSNFLAGTALEQYVTVLKKADLKIKEVSAASIIAKVARDNYMVEISKKYPEYGFEKHVGYGTAAHRQALDTYGPCLEHRKSFKPVKGDTSTTTGIGRRAEDVVADYLASHGHNIIARNHKTKFYEIDIISEKGKKIYFTEVKYRKDTGHGSPLLAVDKKKQQQMNFAAEAFLKLTKSKLQPVLAVASVTGAGFEIEDWFELD